VPARTDARARRKEELRLLARIERMEVAQMVRDVRRLKKPINFAMVGARIFQAWRNPAWVSTAATLLAARGIDSTRTLRALRYAGYAFAAWRTWRLFRQYVPGARPGADSPRD
jgi:hypothetical protein